MLILGRYRLVRWMDWQDVFYFPELGEIQHSTGEMVFKAKGYMKKKSEEEKKTLFAINIILSLSST